MDGIRKSKRLKTKTIITDPVPKPEDTKEQPKKESPQLSTTSSARTNPLFDDTEVYTSELYDIVSIPSRMSSLPRTPVRKVDKPIEPAEGITESSKVAGDQIPLLTTGGIPPHATPMETNDPKDAPQPATPILDRNQQKIAQENDLAEELERKHREERSEKLKILRERKQTYVIPGAAIRTHMKNGEGSSTDRVETPNAAGRIVNHLDLHQQQLYSNAWHINRLENAENKNKLRVAGHDLYDLSDKEEIYRWWIWAIKEMRGPPRLLAMKSSMMNFTVAPDSRGKINTQGYGPQPIHIEFPTRDAPEWVLEEGIRNCWRLQQYPGLEHLSFSPVLTMYEVKMQKYVNTIVKNMRDNINGPDRNRSKTLSEVKRIRTFGKKKNHICLMDAAGKEMGRVHYNNIIVDEYTKTFLPLEGGVVALPPSDFAYQPQETTLLEVDYDAEAHAMGTEVQGRKEGIFMKIPDFVAPSMRRMLNANEMLATEDESKNTGLDDNEDEDGNGEGETTTRHDLGSQNDQYEKDRRASQRGKQTHEYNSNRGGRGRGRYPRQSRPYSNTQYSYRENNEGRSNRGRGRYNNRSRSARSQNYRAARNGRNGPRRARGNARPYEREFEQTNRGGYDDTTAGPSGTGNHRETEGTETRGYGSTNRRRARGTRNSNRSRGRGSRQDNSGPKKRHPYKKYNENEEDDYYDNEETEYNYYEEDDY